MRHTPTGRQPDIVIGRADHTLLSALASAGAGSSDALLGELERARIVEDAALPPNVVRMGSTVGYTVDGRDPTTVTLVYPADADISQGRVSVLTPIGTALIGLAPGQSIAWTTRDGRERTLRITTVVSGTTQASAAPDAGYEPDDPGPSAA